MNTKSTNKQTKTNKSIEKEKNNKKKEINNPIQEIMPIKKSKLEKEIKISYFIKEDLYNKLKVICSLKKTSIKDVMNGILEKKIEKETKELKENILSYLN